jgi:hypothetical protein
MLAHPVSEAMIADCLSRLVKSGWLAFATSSLSPSGRLRERAYGVCDVLAIHERERQALGITVMRAGANSDPRWNVVPDVLRSPFVRAWLGNGGHAWEIWTISRGSRRDSFEVNRSPVYAASLDFRLTPPSWPRGRQSRQTAGRRRKHVLT